MRLQRHTPPALRLVVAALAVLTTACAGSGTAREAGRSSGSTRSQIVQAALAQVGAPYLTGGSSPQGFDCSGLVVYSYAKGGITGLPHSAAELEHTSSRVSLPEVQPGDLLFFRLGLTRHVGIYVDDRAFVHAPVGGDRVERVSFDHPYWSRRLGRAGRLLH